jgi:hypothetical protein
MCSKPYMPKNHAVSAMLMLGQRRPKEGELEKGEHLVMCMPAASGWQGKQQQATTWAAVIAHAFANFAHFIAALCAPGWCHRRTFLRWGMLAGA